MKGMFLSNNVESITIVGSNIVILEYIAWYIAPMILSNLF